MDNRQGHPPPPRRRAQRLSRSSSPAPGILPANFYDNSVSSCLCRRDTFPSIAQILPSFNNKRQVVDIFQQVESDISAYLVTITLMNAAVGIATAMVMWLTGIGDPILWGAVAFPLNFVPILALFLAKPSSSLA